MEKALNVLKDLCLVINFNSYWQPRVHEAIAELEALQQPKQCNTCRFYHSFTGVCANDNCHLCADFVDADFGCIYHKPKEK